MKLSVYAETGFKKVRRAVVTMDGRRLKRVVRVDTCAGVAWVHESNADGTLRTVRSGRDSWAPVVLKVYGPIKVSEVEP